MRFLVQRFFAFRQNRVATLIALTAFLMTGTTICGAQTIPTDAKATCTVPTATFNSWFQSGHAAANGVVNPANSVTFSNPAANCPFYQWSEQMFLWLTSPSPTVYGGGSRVMDTPVFYDVSPPNATTGKRTFIPHQQGMVLRNFSLRAAQAGPHGLPVIVDTTGRVFEVTTPAPTEKPMIRSTAGALVPLATVSRTIDQKLVLQDAAGKQIVRPQITGQVATAAARVSTVKKFVLPGGIIFVDPAGNVIESEEGQADNGVLLSQKGSLVYYVTMVNDVYAYFATMVAHQTTKTTQFPTSQAALNPIVSFASSHGKTFPDPSALAIEIKSSWVDASTLPTTSGYITMPAIVPTYNTSNPAKWTPSGQKQVTLALVGVHVVGSANGHPEMIWATFEHFGNAPSGAYSYITATGATKTVSQSTAGSWLFSKTNSTGPFNNVHAQLNAPNIVGVSPQQITPSDTLRMMAWGSASNAAPSPLVTSAAAANTEIISIHNSIAGQLPASDIRSNYFMLGATWTEGGAAPTTSFASPGNTGGNVVGTSQLNNSTMETYQQSPTTSFSPAGGNCLTCHGTNTTNVSHDFPALQPLF